MLSIDALRAWGAEVDDGLRRCMNNEAFYLRLVEKAARDDTCVRLKAAVEAGDLDGAFDLAHALKGVTANLALTPLQTPVTAMSDLLKAHAEADYAALLADVLAARDGLLALLD